jgi:hypothetical protein
MSRQGQDGPDAAPSIGADGEAAVLRARLADSVQRAGKALNLLRAPPRCGNGG